MHLVSIYYDNNGTARAIVEGDRGIEYCTSINRTEWISWCSCEAYVYSSIGLPCKHIRFLNKNLDVNKMVDRTDELFKLPTGCKTVDDLLGGGIPHKLITALFGDPATGKSWLAYQSGVNNIKINKKKTLLIDTEGLTQNDLDNILGKLRSRFGVSEKEIKENFQMIKTYNDPQMHSIQKLLQMFGYMVLFEMSEKGGKYKVIFKHCEDTLKPKELEGISMIILDSLTKPIKDSIGSETANLPARAQIVERLFGKLHQVADLYNIAVIVIHHQSNPPPVGPYRIKPYAYGGNPVYYNSKYILQIFDSTKKERDIKCKENQKKTWQIEARRIALVRRPDEQATGEKIPIRLMKDFGFTDG